MRICHEHKIVFFSNPKTGSSTVRKFLDPFSDQVPGGFRSGSDYPHLRAEEARSCFEKEGWDFGGYSRFVCVRNPWARLLSLYHYVLRKTALPPFTDWIAGLGNREQPDTFGSASLEGFIKDGQGNVLVDRVLRTEDLDQELVPYLHALGLPISPDIELPRHNATGIGSGYVKHYSRANAELVRDLYQYEIMHYGYRFGDPA